MVRIKAEYRDPPERRQGDARARVAAQALGELEKPKGTCYKGRVIGPDDFRRALGHFASGVTVVTTMDDEARPTGLTASAVSSVSLDPPLVLVCVACNANCYPAFREGGRFAVNILASDQEAVARRFASSSLTGAQKFEGVGYQQSALGLPVLKDALAELECTVVHAYPGGDHTIFVGRVEAIDTRGDLGREPLLYYRGRFDRLQNPGGKP
jgi:flavin reductase (DIM6/NTAB) family NADH-FMN oxidoreductase RutF